MKRILLARLVVMTLFGCSLTIAPFLRAEASGNRNPINRIEKIKWIRTHGNIIVSLNGQQFAHYSTFVLHNPLRLVIDFKQTDLSALKGPFFFKRGPLAGIEMQQFTNSALSLARLVFTMRSPSRWKIWREKHRMNIKIWSTRKASRRKSLLPRKARKSASVSKMSAFHSSTSSYRITYEPRRVSQGEPPVPPAAPGGLPGGRGAPSPGSFGNTASQGDMLMVLAKRRKKKVYHGHRTSMYFRKVEIHNLLRLFAEVSGLNIITSDQVKGRVTLKLRNVPWDQALDLVLKTLKLGMEREGNIIRIATLKELQEERQARRKLLEAQLLSQPQKIRLITVNYAQAQDMAARVKSVLSPRGQVTVDPRTNVLIVKDYVAFLIRAEGLVRSLDTQTPQVLIETRIVEANVNFEQQFGIQWGGHLLFSPMTGNSTGLAFPNPLGIRGGVPDAAAGGAGGGGGGGGGAAGGASSSSTGMFGTPNYIVNFPASVGQGQGTALSFLFGTLTGVASLQLRLSAAESRGHVKVISAPKIVTLHKLSASIRQGLQIPFTSASAAGTQTQFIAATLSLNVTPQVTTDGSVFLRLNITNNAPDFSRGGAAGPAITTKSAQTNMLIKDGETMVIGGVYTRTTGWKQSRIPFFSQIPVLGLLFKNYSQSDDRAELLIFVTPRIINRAYTLGGRQGS